MPRDKGREQPSLNESRYLTVNDAAKYLSVTPHALRCRMSDRSIPAWTYTRMGGSVRFLREALDQWLGYQQRMASAKKACA